MASKRTKAEFKAYSQRFYKIMNNKLILTLSVRVKILSTLTMSDLFETITKNSKD